MNTTAEETIDFIARRKDMVEQQIAARGILSRHVLRAMETVPREKFLPQHLRQFAYRDAALPIAEQQTISQPYIVALMIEALQLGQDDRVLDVGTGSGYAAAVLAEIAQEVVSIECIESLTVNAQQVIRQLGYRNVQVVHGDGSVGWKARAPYNAIIVAAGAPAVPEALKSQLTIGGRLVLPVGDNQRYQTLIRIDRISETEFEQTELADVRFVPMVGRAGWQEFRSGPGD